MTIQSIQRRVWAGTGVLALIGLFAAPFAAFATVAPVTFTTDTPVVVPGSNIALTILAGSTADSVVVDTNTVTIDSSGSESLQISADHNNRMSNDKGLDPCGRINSRVTLTVTSAQNGIVITPSATICAASNGGGGSGGGGGGGTTASTIQLTAPPAGSNVTAGTNVSVNWSTTGTGITGVNLAYSANAGSSFTTIANTGATGPFSWAVPSTLSGSVILRAIGHDSSGGTLSTSQITVVVQAASTTTPPPTTTQPPSTTSTCSSDAACGITRDSAGHRVAPPSGATGPSPITGQMQPISQVHTGQFIRSFGFNTVYLVLADGSRRPFWGPTTFFTYASSFDQIVWVTDATLPTMPINSVMLPKPGVVLVKIQSDPKTYEVTFDASATPTLHWITTEAVAVGRYGANWADYVIDVEPTLFTHYHVGASQLDATAQDKSQMKTRAQIAALVATGM